MEYSDTYFREVLPSDDPPYERVPGEVDEDIHAWADRAEVDDRNLIARGARWTYAMFSELGEGQYRLQRGYYRRWPEGWPEYFPHVDWNLNKRASIGLFDREHEEAGFGLVITAPPWPGPSFEIVDQIEFPRLNSTRFPLAVRHLETEPHALLHPNGATSACWARCNTSNLWGVITAGHAVSGNRPGRPVPLAAGGVGSLVRSFYQPIDAAFVHVSVSPTGPSLLPTFGFPTTGQPVTVETQGGPKSRTIVSVMNSMGVLHTREFAVLLCLDQPCIHGDSGSLVRLSTGEAVGIYKGGMKTPRTQYPVVGLAQNFEQAIFALSVTPFS
jgi:hypothetical protein